MKLICAKRSLLMLPQNTVFVSNMDVYKFYETNKPQVIRINQKLLDKQIEDLLENDKNNLNNYNLLKYNIRNVHIHRPLEVLNIYNKEIDEDSKVTNNEFENLLNQAKECGCLKKWEI